MSITADQNADGRPGGHPPTAVQCALAVVTAGLAVAAAMLALGEQTADEWSAVVWRGSS